MFARCWNRVILAAAPRRGAALGEEPRRVGRAQLRGGELAVTRQQLQRLFDAGHRGQRRGGRQHLLGREVFEAHPLGESPVAGEEAADGRPARVRAVLEQLPDRHPVLAGLRLPPEHARLDPPEQCLGHVVHALRVLAEDSRSSSWQSPRVMLVDDSLAYTADPRRTNSEYQVPGRDVPGRDGGRAETGVRAPFFTSNRADGTDVPTPASAAVIACRRAGRSASGSSSGCTRRRTGSGSLPWRRFP